MQFAAVFGSRGRIGCRSLEVGLSFLVVTVKMKMTMMMTVIPLWDSVVAVAVAILVMLLGVRQREPRVVNENRRLVANVVLMAAAAAVAAVMKTQAVKTRMRPGGVVTVGETQRVVVVGHDHDLPPNS